MLDQVTALVNDVKAGKIAPVYLLMGEEPYYIDRIASFLDNTLLSEEEKSFNQVTLYGRDVTIEDIVSQAKRYPMMAERQVVIVKEAQELARTIEKLSDYLENPQQTTVLVICYKYKKIDKRKAVYKAFAKAGVIYESKKLYDNQVGDWIRRLMSSKGYTVTPKAGHMLVEFLGTDLGKINNELEKLEIVLPKGSTIDPEAVELHIGISKDFNNFELRKAIGERDSVKAHRIANYFANNPKDNPLVVTIAQLFSFFSQLLQYHGLPQKDKGTVAKTLGINPYFVREYVTAAQNYPMKRVSQIISMIREVDVKGKGVGAGQMAQGDLLRELLVKMMT
ncbi:DNA polymerase III subunit delta [Croceiramulus getboli]|nr:DNA polymerase III subunit delta [Flavobacteriaceae bacterium YJPT1-3]